MLPEAVYSSSVSSKTALIAETLQVFAEYVQNSSIEHVRNLVIQDNILLKKTEGTRHRIWRVLFTRYFSGRDAQAIDRLARVVDSLLPESSRHLILFYELAQSDALIYDLTVDFLYGLHESGRSIVTKSDVLAWLEAAEAAGHEEIAGWSPQTKGKVASNYLTITRDFGLLEGAQNKRFTRLFVPLPTFVYVLYRLHDAGLNTRAIVESSDFRLFLLDEREISLLLEEATRAGYVTFQQAGDVYNLTFHYRSTAEVVDELIRQVQ